MGFIFRSNRPPVGTRPGVIQVLEGALPTKVHVVVYDEHQIEEFSLTDKSEIEPLKQRSGVLWIDVQGLGDVEWLRALGQAFGMHALSISDLVHVPQRAKYELYDTYALIITSMVRPNNEIEQLSVVLGDSMVLTFQERYGDVFDPVRSRLRAGKGAIRKSKSDYLCYTLIDAVVDGYFPTLELLGDSLEEIEEELLSSPSVNSLHELYRMRRDLLHLRRALWPLREAIGTLIRDHPKQMKKNTLVFFRDVYDHLLQVIDVLESYRELSSGLMELYLSSTNNRMNEVMKTLTMISTLFIPLSFLAGVYGMNFDHMPELAWKWSYPVFWAIVVLSSLSMLYLFWRRGWLK